MLSYIKILRAKHWIKNLFLFAAPFFGGKLFHTETLATAIPAFIAFSLCASSSYIYNDIRDAENDRHHPKKKSRVIASGRISKGKALPIAAFLGAASFILSYKIAPFFLFFVLIYFLIQMFYSTHLKNIPVVDIFCIASGFVIRVLAGGAAFHIEVSEWLLLTMFMISLVLAAGKRLGEVNLLDENANTHRKSLTVYSISTLNEILLISSASSLIAYSLYTVEQFHRLIYTIPVVTFGLFRYLLLSKQGVGDPTEALTKDKWLAATVLMWLLLVWLIRYNY